MPTTLGPYLAEALFGDSVVAHCQVFALDGFTMEANALVISLNVGGVTFMTTTTTISNMSPFFQKLFEARDPRDDSQIFIDREPRLFTHVLNYSRTSGASIAELVGMPACDLHALLIEAEYYEMWEMAQGILFCGLMVHIEYWSVQRSMVMLAEGILSADHRRYWLRVNCSPSRVYNIRGRWMPELGYDIIADQEYPIERNDTPGQPWTFSRRNRADEKSDG